MMSSTVNVPPVVVNGISYSRREIADAVGLHVSTISKYFTGTRRPSTSATLVLASYFGVSMEFLLTKVLPFASVQVAQVATVADPAPATVGTLPLPLAEAV
jgi:transcriptional regulator with XRE-family HTH domain